MAVAKKEKAPKRKIEEVKIVKFSGAASESDSQDVFLGVNGQTIVIKRGIEVPLPMRFILAAKNAVINNYTYDEDGNRHWTSSTDRFPLSIVRDSSWKEYRSFLSKGKNVTDHNKVQRG